MRRVEGCFKYGQRATLNTVRVKDPYKNVKFLNILMAHHYLRDMQILAIEKVLIAIWFGQRTFVDSFLQNTADWFFSLHMEHG